MILAQLCFPMSNVIVFSTQMSSYLGDEVANALGAERGLYTVNQFADGEDEHILTEQSLKGLHWKDAVLLGSTHDAKNYLELTDLLSLLRQENARSVMAVVPYLGWSTQERCNVSGQATKAYNRVRGVYRHNPDLTMFVGLHNSDVMQAHDGRRLVEEIDPRPLVGNYVRENYSLDKVTLVAPDVGRGKAIVRIAKDLKLEHVILSKDRYGVDQVRVEDMNRNLRGRIAFLYDDMIRTGGTILAAINQCIAAEAEKVVVLSTHAVLPRNPDPASDPEQRLDRSRVDSVVVTNSHPRSQSIASPKFRVLSIANLITDRLKGFLARSPQNGFAHREDKEA